MNNLFLMLCYRLRYVILGGAGAQSSCLFGCLIGGFQLTVLNEENYHLKIFFLDACKSDEAKVKHHI